MSQTGDRIKREKQAFDFIRDQWDHFRSLAMKAFKARGRNALIVDLGGPLSIDGEIRCLDLKTILGDTTSFGALAGQAVATYNEEREIVFLLHDKEAESVKVETVSERKNGAPNLLDRNWIGRDMECPRCGHLFIGLSDARQCPKCRHRFVASYVREDAKRGSFVDPIVAYEPGPGPPQDLRSLMLHIDRIERRLGIDGLSEMERMIWIVLNMDAEVCNGGFQQYFYNQAGDHAAEAVRGLERMGAKGQAKLVQCACDVFPSGAPSTDTDQRQVQMAELPGSTGEVWDRLTSKYYNRRSNLEKQVWRAWRAATK